MESLPDCELLEFNKNTLNEVREMYDLHKPGSMAQAVDILETWVKTQHHFTKKDFDRAFLERRIIANKGSVERAKSRLDKECTLRTLMPHLFGSYDLKKMMETDLEDMFMTFLPKMTKDNKRVFLLHNPRQFFTPTMFLSFNRMMVAVSEYNKRHDYAAGYHAVLDYMDVNMVELVKAITLNELQETIAYCFDGCGFRISEISILSNHKLVEIIVRLLKQVMKKKLGDRVCVYNSREALLEKFEKDLLPKEYGGTERSLPELKKQWLDHLMSDKMVDYLKDINGARTDEAKRQTDKFNEQCMGMPGTFRTLNVD